ncbi:MAG TPA: type I phosphomannose isomerase catalytic subunit [Ktedonobacterales bacterium]
MSTTSKTLAPIHLRSSLHPTIWGGRNLIRIAGKQLPDEGKIGESWETATDTVALNDPYTGQTLGALVDQYGEALIGARAAEVFGMRFPLLAKFIDAQDQLSVQVHPNDEYASAHEKGSLGKTEAWYILQADDGAEIVYGLKEQATENEIRQAIAKTRLEDYLRRVKVHAGDIVLVPAGTVHAICAGIVLYELQEYSDVTYRLYDYGRLQSNGQPRELHVEQSLAVMNYAPPEFNFVKPVVVDDDQPEQRRVLVGCRYFVEEEARIQGEAPGLERPASCQIISVLQGSCEVVWPGGSVLIGLGETVVLPAAIGPHTLQAGFARVLRSWVPDENDDLLRKWRAAQSVVIRV